MAKHGNPAGGNLSFTLSLKDNEIYLSRQNLNYLIVLLYAAEINVLRSIKAAIKILENNKIELSAFKSVLENLDKKTNDIFTDDLKRLLMDYIKQNNPEIAKLDDEIERIQKEKVELEEKIARLKKELEKYN